MNDIKIARRIAELVKNEGGTAYYVGGYVRDRLMKLENKDIALDINFKVLFMEKNKRIVEIFANDVLVKTLEFSRKPFSHNNFNLFRLLIY